MVGTTASKNKGRQNKKVRRRFTKKVREAMAKKGLAMPGGRYPISDTNDLRRAIRAFGRSKTPNATKRWIEQRALQLDAMDLLPKKWIVDRLKNAAAKVGTKFAKGETKKAAKAIARSKRK